MAGGGKGQLWYSRVVKTIERTGVGQSVFESHFYLLFIDDDLP